MSGNCGEGSNRQDKVKILSHFVFPPPPVNSNALNTSMLRQYLENWGKPNALGLTFENQTNDDVIDLTDIPDSQGIEDIPLTQLLHPSEAIGCALEDIDFDLDILEPSSQNLISIDDLQVECVEAEDEQETVISQNFIQNSVGPTTVHFQNLMDEEGDNILMQIVEAEERQETGISQNLNQNSIGSTTEIPHPQNLMDEDGDNILIQVVEAEERREKANLDKILGISKARAQNIRLLHNLQRLTKNLNMTIYLQQHEILKLRKN